ncbi:MAG: hypothetical protein O3A10_10260 [Chloroflexi bacterium]|nr:hypothetical protein [Chloroflexota bacterium]MDA1146488.1 hypothetical protein [Chloroflexota bacterium]PKB56660.1 MAG: hypothetical protein BZY69_00675 [SAR202 cluster bacterium Casp-Chloro-G1]
MGLGLAITMFLGIGVVLGFMVIQAMFAARKWRSVIRGGDHGALMQLLDLTFEGWRTSRPAKGTPPADFRALHTAALIAADRERIRVSMLAEADVRVVDGKRDEVANEYVVARRAAVRMVERLLYEVPYASFNAAQVDVNLEYRDAAGATLTRCLLTTIARREVAQMSDWRDGDPEELLAEWQTRDGERGTEPDPDRAPLITADEVAAVVAAERAVREPSR